MTNPPTIKVEVFSGNRGELVGKSPQGKMIFFVRGHAPSEAGEWIVVISEEKPKFFLGKAVSKCPSFVEVLEYRKALQEKHANLAKHRKTETHNINGISALFILSKVYRNVELVEIGNPLEELTPEMEVLEEGFWGNHHHYRVTIRHVSSNKYEQETHPNWEEVRTTAYYTRNLMFEDFPYEKATQYHVPVVIRGKEGYTRSRLYMNLEEGKKNVTENNPVMFEGEIPYWELTEKVAVESGRVFFPGKYIKCPKEFEVVNYRGTGYYEETVGGGHYE